MLQHLTTTCCRFHLQARTVDGHELVLPSLFQHLVVACTLDVRGEVCVGFLTLFVRFLDPFEEILFIHHSCVRKDVRNIGLNFPYSVAKDDVFVYMFPLIDK